MLPTRNDVTDARVRASAPFDPSRENRVDASMRRRAPSLVEGGRMHRSTLRYGAALLALLATAACDTPTATPAARQPGQTPARFTLSPATGLSVTNSGGYPLISWTAPAGATSFKVSLINYIT